MEILQIPKDNKYNGNSETNNEYLEDVSPSQISGKRFQMENVKNYVHQKNHKKPIVILSLDITESKAEQIYVYENDDPTVLSREFCGKWELDEEIRNIIENKLREQIEEYYSKVIKDRPLQIPRKRSGQTTPKDIKTLSQNSSKQRSPLQNSDNEELDYYNDHGSLYQKEPSELMASPVVYLRESNSDLNEYSDPSMKKENSESDIDHSQSLKERFQEEKKISNTHQRPIHDYTTSIQPLEVSHERREEKIKLFKDLEDSSFVRAAQSKEVSYVHSDIHPYWQWRNTSNICDESAIRNLKRIETQKKMLSLMEELRQSLKSSLSQSKTSLETLNHILNQKESEVVDVNLQVSKVQPEFPKTPQTNASQKWSAQGQELSKRLQEAAKRREKEKITAPDLIHNGIQPNKGHSLWEVMRTESKILYSNDTEDNLRANTSRERSKPLTPKTSTPNSKSQRTINFSNLIESRNDSNVQLLIKVFVDLDSDHDGRISSENINLRVVNPEILSALDKVLLELKYKKLVLNFTEFIELVSAHKVKEKLLQAARKVYLKVIPPMFPSEAVSYTHLTLPTIYSV
eukprot:TRINITY_DN2087_c0_g2_i8.p1 TRINITY_DN2087_c0_g2~~TRINITY_DN2087_c0_g2_i8.p1  ORF type:complete len:574 (-),score=79.95 TRINITY_DN2087_c0_g2_i8:36-1757(-)